MTVRRPDVLFQAYLCGGHDVKKTWAWRGPGQGDREDEHRQKHTGETHGVRGDGPHGLWGTKQLNGDEHNTAAITLYIFIGHTKPLYLLVLRRYHFITWLRVLKEGGKRRRNFEIRLQWVHLQKIFKKTLSGCILSEKNTSHLFVMCRYILRMQPYLVFRRIARTSAKKIIAWNVSERQEGGENEVGFTFWSRSSRKKYCWVIYKSVNPDSRQMAVCWLHVSPLWERGAKANERYAKWEWCTSGVTGNYVIDVIRL